MDRLPERIMIIAGTMDQYRHFRRQLADVLIHELDFDIGHYDIQYIGTADAIRGCNNIWGYRVGTWADRPDINDIITALQLQRSSIDNFIEVSI
jgi:hypothetical protein